MIKAEELRLGNLVLCNHKIDLISIVECIQPNSVTVVFDRQPDLINGAICSPNDLIPIQLTEEWLLKFGFDKKTNKRKNNITVYSKSIFKACFDNGCLYVYKSYVSSGYICKIQSVHQLQNLFWCLCNEELTIKN